MFHFPVGVRELTLFSPPPVGTLGTRVVLNISAIEPDRIVADAEVFAGDRVYARLVDFTSQRFYLPRHLRPLGVPTALADICRPVPLIDFGLDETRSAAVSLSTDAVRDEQFLTRVWAARILTRDERRRWQGGDSDSQSVRWLAGRQVAKEAVRNLLAERLETNVRLADVEITRAGGGYLATAAATSDADRAPDWPPIQVWTAQAGDRAVALASLEDLPGVGSVLEQFVAVDPPTVIAPSGRHKSAPESVDVAVAGPRPEDVMVHLRQTIDRLSGDWEIDQPITPDARLIGDLGMKSIDLVVIASAMVNAYGLIPFDELYAEMARIPAEERDLTVARLVEFVCQRVPRGAVTGRHAQS